VTAADTLCTGSPDGPVRRITSPALAQMTGGACCLRWSPDGQRLLIRLTQSVGVQQLDDISMVNSDGSGLVNLTSRPEDANWGADWSPDGTQIVFNSGRGPEVTNANLHLWVMNADGSDLHRITTIWGEYPAWSPDGHLIAFQSNRCACNSVGGEAEYDIYTVHPDGSGLRRLTSLPGGEGVSGWSPDGQTIAFSRNPEMWPGIWTMTRTGGHVRHLRPPDPPGVHIRGVEGWAPGDSFIVYGIEGEDPQTAPGASYWVSPDGRSTTRLELEGQAGGARWRPTGAGKAVTVLTLEHHWVGTSSPRLKLVGRLTADGEPVAGRQIMVGRLGDTLPTERLRTVTTDHTGSFTVLLDLAGSPPQGSAAFRAYWRDATAFFAGSDTEWSTTAFEPLQTRD
jgi:Tol biopolymer transport system component